jgi:SAM-dependent methyltransferase
VIKADKSIFAKLKTLKRRAQGRANLLDNARWVWRGLNYTAKLGHCDPPGAVDRNDLQVYFDEVQTGPGIWKWEHYFNVYDRHFSKFRNRAVNVLEIGIYSGGSLGMWRRYFGKGCTVFGIDIEPSCRVYEEDGVRVFIGDQSDRSFWRKFKSEAPLIDIVVDDGAHLPLAQTVSFEELFPHLSPGGVYLCEDLHGRFNAFSAYVNGLANQLNDCSVVNDLENQERRLSSKTSDFQSAVDSIHIYPFVAIIEKRSSPLAELVSPKHGTQWQPFGESWLK